MGLPTLKRYTYMFAALNLVLVLIGAFVGVVVYRWRTLLAEPVGSNPKIYTRLTVSNIMVHAGFAFTGASALAAVLSLWTLCTSPKRTSAMSRPPAVYLIVLVAEFLLTMGIATSIWFTTLRERSLFTPVWIDLPDPQKVYIQDDLQCCGWFNATTQGLFNDKLKSGFCHDPDSIIPNPDPNVVIGCVDKVGKKADDIMNNTFTVTYGFTGVQFALFLIAACIAKLRMQEKRFLRIDYKLRINGKGGFV